MIGLEIMMAIKGLSGQDLADKLVISRQGVNAWLKKRKTIARNKYKLLNEIFPEVPDIFFGKEISSEEKAYITLILLKDELKDNDFMKNTLEEAVLKIKPKISL